MKKIVLMGLSLVLVAVLSIGGTLAYLTDRDSEANVFTVGNVDIDLTEEFEQGAELIPGVEVEKEVAIENTGANDAWVWYTITYPKALDLTTSGKTILWTGFTTENHDNAGYAGANDGEVEWLIEYTAAPYLRYFTKDGVEMVEFTVLYQAPLKAGETTPGSLECVYFDKAIDIDPEGNLAHVANGTVENIDWNVKEKGNPVVYVSAYAIQKDQFNTVQEAYAAYQGQWAGNGIEYQEAYTLVSNADELVAALEAGRDVAFTDNIKIDPANMSNAYGTTGINVKDGQTINGNGYTLDIKGAGGTWDSGINTTGGEIKNLKVTGSFRGVFINHNSTYSEPVILDNVIIEGTTYTISCDQGLNQNFEAWDSTFNGWTSYAATLGTATFNDCKFGYGNGYSFMRPYAPTTFVGCEFEAGYKMDARAAVTFENCTLDGVAITADNLATLVTSNIANATVK